MNTKEKIEVPITINGSCVFVSADYIKANKEQERKQETPVKRV